MTELVCESNPRSSILRIFDAHLLRTRLVADGVRQQASPHGNAPLTLISRDRVQSWLHVALAAWGDPFPLK